MVLGSPLALIDVGQYVSAWKAIPLLLLVLGWARFLTWMDKDSSVAYLPRVPLNIGFLGGLIIALLLFMSMPNFWAGFIVILLVIAGEIGAYAALRFNKIGMKDLHEQWNQFCKSLMLKKTVSLEAKEGEILLVDRSGATIPVPSGNAPEYPSYLAVQGLLTMPLRLNAERIDLVVAEGGYTVRHYIDGVGHDDPPMDFANAHAAIACLKQLAGLDLNEKRKPQCGSVKFALSEQRRVDAEVRVAGSKAGESMRILINPMQRHSRRLSDLGLFPDQLKLLQASVKENQGIVLVGAIKGHGLSSMLYALIREHDAFVNHLQTIEHNPEITLEGITQNKIPPTATAADEAMLVTWVTSQEPDVILIDRIDDPRSIQELVRFVAVKGKRVYIGMRGATTLDMLATWRKAIGDDALAMKHLRLVIAGRLVRKLCDACKAGYVPDPNTLRKLNMDPEKVGKLYQALSNPLKDSRGRLVVCPICQNVRFKGRTGIFETLVIDEEIRKVVLGGGSLNQLKAGFRRLHGRYLQEQGLALVESGTTSIEEVVRALRSGESAPPPQPQVAGGRSGS